MKDGIYFVCPKCKEFLEYFKELRREENEFQVFYSNNDWNSEEYRPVDCAESEHILTFCPECDFRSQNYSATEFAVMIEDNKVIDVESYWSAHLEELKEIAKENNLGWEA